MLRWRKWTTTGSSLVVKHTSIWILVIVCQFDLEFEYMDMKTIFLYGKLEEKIYMKHLQGYIQEGQEKKVCLLKMSLYGVKQSPR